MLKKRLRGSLDLLGDIDDLLRMPDVSSPLTDVDDSPQDAGEESKLLRSGLTDACIVSASPLLKRHRASSSTRGATDFFSCSLSLQSPSAPTAAESLGGDEIDLLRRKDEERADMALFLARTVAETASASSLMELVKYLEETGTASVLLALKRGASTEAFLHCLATTRPRPVHRVLLLCLLVECAACVSLEAFFQRSVVAFILDALTPAAGSTQAAPPAVSPVRAAAAHWSARPKRASAASPVAAVQSPLGDQQDEALRRRMEALCPSVRAAGLSCANSSACAASLALHLLLRLLLAHNRSVQLVTPSAFSVPLAVVRGGGLDHIGALLRETTTRAASLSLLEVLTASDALRSETTRLLGLVPVLLDLLGPADAAALATDASVLKVLTDVTHLIPTAFSDTNTEERFATFMKSVVAVPGEQAEVDERETFVLCCAINVVLHEAREKTISAVAVDASSLFTQALVADGALLSTLAASMTVRYHSSEAEQLVLSGYAALLLAALSLVVVDPDGTTLRVPVITAVAAASRGTRIGKSTDRQPMRMVAAIIQEFLLFQSASGTLTKEALVEMDSLVARLRRHNHISVAAEGSEAVEAEEKDEEEVTLGDLL